MQKVRRYGRQMPFWLLLGFGISAIGAPLALVSIYPVSIIGPYYTLAGIASLIGVMLFFFPLLIWYNYSRKIASSGGLYEFVRRTAGDKIAKIQGAFWAFSYFLYLPYTVTYILYYILPTVVNIPTFYLYALEIVLPIVLSLFMMFGKRNVFVFLFLIGLAQVIAVLLLGSVSSFRSGLSFQTVQNTSPANLSLISFGLSLLFICTSLILFLGGEVQGGAGSIRRALLYSFSIVAIISLFFFLASSALYSQSPDKSFSMALIYQNSSFLLIIGSLTILGIAGLILAEYVALSRLLNRMLNLSIDRSLLYIGVSFIAFDLISLVNPYEFYNYTLTPSLVALFISQLIVFVVYPMFRRRYYSLTPLDVFATVVASFLMLYGVYSTLVTYLPLI